MLFLVGGDQELLDFIYMSTFGQLATLMMQTEIRNRFKFRVTRESMLHFIDNLVGEDLVPTRRNNALSARTQVLTSSRFLAVGSFQQGTPAQKRFNKALKKQQGGQLKEHLANLKVDFHVDNSN